MKKLVLTSAFIFVAFAAFAQKSVVKQAKNETDAAKAAEILAPALVDPETGNDPETWLLAGDIQKKIYDAENMKLYLGQPADTNKYYNSLYNMFEYYQKCDDLEQALVQSGELKKPKLRKKYDKELLNVRPNLPGAGTFVYNKGDYPTALKYFGLYVDSQKSPIFAEAENVQNDTLVSLIACYATLAANSLHDKNAIIKYANIGKDDKVEGSRAMLCLAEVYRQGEKADSVQWLAVVKEGAEKYPNEPYFTGNLMDYYIQTGNLDEGLADINEKLAQNETAYYLYIKGVLQFEKKDYDNAIATFQKLIDRNEDYLAEGYSKIGDCYFFPAQSIIEENGKLAIDDPVFAQNEEKVKALYEKARPYYEKAKKLAPGDKQLWGQFLLNIYWALNKAEYETLEKELAQ